jgi:hypothetical protein
MKNMRAKSFIPVFSACRRFADFAESLGMIR